MISPLGQRQILQTASVETVKQAMEGGLLVQREQARRQAFSAKLAEAQVDVPDISESEALKLTHRDAQDSSGGHQHGTGSSEELPPDETEGLPAEGARSHLDLLA
ncbi:MAG: hypothetical protein P4L11_14605 [Geothrix sp.]|jgi:hypothetical protein|nr:hypothetical protein [Geothrix sp.]